MNDLPTLPPASAAKGASAAETDPTEGFEGAAEGQRTFDDALGDRGELHESQAPDTRRAIKDSLDRLPRRPGAQAGVPDAAQGQQARPAANGPAHSGAPLPPGSSALAVGAASRKLAGASAAGPAKALAGQPEQPSPSGPESASPAADRNSAPQGGTPGRAPAAAPAGPGSVAGRAGVDVADGSPGARAAPVAGHSQAAQQPPAGPSGLPRQGEGAIEFGLTRGAGRPDARRPDDAGTVDAPSIDLTGLAVPADAPGPANVAVRETAPASASRTAELAEQVADRILVSVPEPGSGGEVRISLNESQLDGSDVRIFREAGELRIVFVPMTEAAGRFLADNGSAFQQALGERLQDERVRIEVQSPGSGAADQQDSEGRSRQRYVSPDDPTGTD